MGNDLPLKGYRVIELASFIAAPCAGRVLADWGAEVIKVEPVEGDVWRFYGESLNCPMTDVENPIFDVYNANKKGVVINMKKPEGLEFFDKLLATADIFLTNTRIEPLKKMKLDYDSIKDKYPKLIFAQATGYGEKGPDYALPGFDIVAFWTRVGYLVDLAKEGQYPMTTPSAFGDTATGMAIFGAICTALINRQKRGHGEKVQVSLYGAGIWYGSCLVTSTQPRYGKKYPQARYESNPNACPYMCSDGEWLMLSLLDFDKHYPRFCKLIGREDFLERFPSKLEMLQNCEEVMKAYEAFFIKYDSVTASQMIKELDIVADRICHFKDVSEDQQAWDNDYLEKVHYPTPGNEGYGAIPNTPIEFTEVKKVPFEKSPLLGQHTVELMKEVGYADDQIKKLLDDKVVVQK